MEKITIQFPFSPIVYVYWGDADYECLYVGQSGFGLARPFDKNHKMYSHRKEVSSIDIYQLESGEEARIVEDALTQLLNPKYDESNLAGNGRKLHIKRISNPPAWALDRDKVLSYLRSRFPNWETNKSQRKTANRLLQIIRLYYGLGFTRGIVARRLNTTQGAIGQVLRRLNKAVDRPAKRPGRPRKTTW
jgi:hypothetical protein